MANIFYSSDHHLGHHNILKFNNQDGTPLRPGFSDVDEMNEYIIEQHNKVVKPGDHAYFLGDFVINKKYLHLASRFNGKLRLVMGNHDIEHVKKFLDAGFEKIMGYRVFVDEFVLSHMPIHLGSVSTRFVANVHGHLHGNRVMKIKHVQGHNIIYSDTEIDPRYYSVCMEQLDDYTPISHEDLKLKIREQMEHAGYERPTRTQGNGPS